MSQVRESQFPLIIPLLVMVVQLCPPGYSEVIRVSHSGPADYSTIQAAIDASTNGDVVLVAPGTYTGDGNRDIDFKGKAITVKSEKGPRSCIIDCQASRYDRHRGFYFHNKESRDSVLDGFTITGGNKESGAGIVCFYRSSPTIRNCVIVGNVGNVGAGICLGDSDALVSNCIIAGNLVRVESALFNDVGGGGLSCAIGHPVVQNCTIYGNQSGFGGGVQCRDGRTTAVFVNCILAGNKASSGMGNQLFSGGCTLIIGCANVELVNCCVEDEPNAIFVENWSNPRQVPESCIRADPLFAQAGYWDFGTEPSGSDGLWINGDYHLKSQAGRWDPVGESWVKDDATSSCIDAGDPNSPVGEEPFPNGGRINMGAYGGTAEASKSPSGLQGKYGGGTGELGSPYYVYMAEQMAGIGAEPNDWSGHFKLMADIDLSGYAGARLQVIGVDENSSFSGVFDGNGHTISGFTRRSSVVSNGGGLFGYVEGTITNLGLTDPNISGEFAPYVGALVRENHGTLTGCFAERVCVAGGDYLAGGLVGRNAGTMTDCHSTGTVSGSSAGGLVGMNRGTIQGCWSAATVTGTDKKVGGLAGDNSPGTITNCYATGVVVTGDDQTGGLIGDNSYGTVTNSYSTGLVTGNDGVGGLVGQSWDGRIINCYSAAEVTGDRIVGGLLGTNTGTVKNCYATGRVSGDRWPIAGLVAWRSNDEVIESFWDVQTSECSWSEGGVGKTTAEMQTAATFLAAGWDFVVETANGTKDIWTILEGEDYPRLLWELPEKP